MIMGANGLYQKLVSIITNGLIEPMVASNWDSIRMSVFNYYLFKASYCL